MKKILSGILVIVVLFFLVSCGAKTVDSDEAMTETVQFTDSCGRTVEIPEKLERIAPAGSVAVRILSSAAPDYLVSITKELTKAEQKYLADCLGSLPVTGQLYSSKGTINLETLIAAAPQVIIDFGDLKDTTAEDMDAIQQQTSIPTIFIASDYNSMASAFRTLGSILYNKQERCNEIADYIDETVAMAAECAAKVTDEERISAMQTSGASGLDTDAEGSYQAQVLELCGIENAIKVDNVSSKGAGNTINLEQLYKFDPDIILFSADSVFDTVGDDPAWQQLSAISSGRYYLIPEEPFNWVCYPPSLNMILGIKWLGNIAYPQYFDFDIAEETVRTFKILWDYDMTLEEANELLANSSAK